MTYWRVLTVVAVALICALPVLAQQVAVTVAPTTIRQEVEAGKEYQFLVHLGNLGTQPLKLKVRKQDFETDEDGYPRALPLGSSSRSCASWLELSETELIVHPGERVQIQLTVNVPLQAMGSYHAIVIYRVAKAPAPGPGVSIVPAVSTVILLTAPTARPVRLALGSISITPGPAGLEFSAPLRNTSIRDCKLSSATLTVMTEHRWRVVARCQLGLGTGTLLAGGRRRLRARWEQDSFEPGVYRARLRVQNQGGEAVANRQVTFRIQP